AFNLMAYRLGFIPSVLLGENSLPPEIVLVSAELSIVTSMFLHGSWMHLGGNMLYLWIFGNNVEDAMGHVRFALFYLGCGAAAALAQAAQDPSSTVPMIGASGAIGGVLGAYILLHPHARILVVIPFGFLIPLRIPAFVVLGVWFIFQFIATASSSGDEGGGVAYWAHIGGFLAGLVLVLVLKRRDVPLFDRGKDRGKALSRRGRRSSKSKSWEEGPWG
ncbi:MAG: rhomboid family intramembrane serine protease, partial [Alphaproteobacteria bacterium]|nr:rhomboid family intramembrane serine protease [Alphaproteobacteria bacterium]